MSTKRIYVIVMCMILLAVVITVSVMGMTYYSSHANTLRLGSEFVSIPEGYEVDQVSEHGGIIKNGDTTLNLYFSDSPTKDGINDYVAKHKNDTLVNETENFNGTDVNIFTLSDDKTNETKIIHLFFDKNNKAYHFSVTGEYDKSAIGEVINSI